MSKQDSCSVSDGFDGQQNEISTEPSVRSISPQVFPVFQYDGLRSRKHIRSLTLYPGNRQEPIRCAVSSVDLDQIDQPYEAISYAWGNATVFCPMECNLATLQIPRSLLKALKVFRYGESDHPRFLWADSICIDQHNVEERSSQVQLMRQIYTRASKVLIWLGHSDVKETELALDLVCQIANTEMVDQEADDAKSAPSATDTVPQAYYSWRNPHDRLEQAMTKYPTRSRFDPSSLRSLCSLFDCRWFSRLWVIQELVLSCCAEVFWGPGSIDFNLIGTAATYVLDNYQPLVYPYPAFSGLKKCYTIYGIWTRRWGPISFFDMLWLARGFNAADPRDKIFGMLGLPTSDYNPDIAAFMEADYTLSKDEVFKAVAKRILITDKEVDLLAMIQHGASVVVEWLSWVPDCTYNSFALVTILHRC